MPDLYICEQFQLCIVERRDDSKVWFGLLVDIVTILISHGLNKKWDKIILKKSEIWFEKEPDYLQLCQALVTVGGGGGGLFIGRVAVLETLFLINSLIHLFF